MKPYPSVKPVALLESHEAGQTIPSSSPGVMQPFGRVDERLGRTSNDESLQQLGRLSRPRLFWRVASLLLPLSAAVLSAQGFPADLDKNQWFGEAQAQVVRSYNDYSEANPFLGDSSRGAAGSLERMLEETAASRGLAGVGEPLDRDGFAWRNGDNDFSGTSSGHRGGAGVLRLRSPITVSGDAIRLGDLFIGLPTRLLSRQVAAAPPPGKTLSLRPSDLRRIVRSYGLQWRPLHSGDGALVYRTGRNLGSNSLEKAILDQYRRQGSSDIHARVRFSDGPPAIFVDSSAYAQLQVTRFTYDPRTRGFRADVAVIENGVQRTQNRVSGFIEAMAELPVLSQPMRAGEIIRPRDVTTRLLRRQEVRGVVVNHTDDLIGKSLRTNLKAGEPILTRAVMEPVLVKRNRTVSVHYNIGGMQLMMRGMPTTNGVRGDTVNVRNPTSKRVIETTVIGQDTVAVPGFEPQPGEIAPVPAQVSRTEVPERGGYRDGGLGPVFDRREGSVRVLR